MVMLCPNCGKDCADSNFCPDCGRRLQGESITQSTEERIEQLRASGEVYCPACLSTSVAIHEDNHIQNEHLLYRNPVAKIIAIVLQEVRRKRARLYGKLCVCLKCGHQWYPKMYALHERHLAYVSHLWEGKQSAGYVVNNEAYLRLNEEGVTIGRLEKEQYFMPYNEIVALEYRKGFNGFYGRFSVRDKANKRKPFPKTYDEALQDELTILYYSSATEVIYQVYCALKSVVEENRKAGLIK